VLAAQRGRSQGRPLKSRAQTPSRRKRPVQPALSKSPCPSQLTVRPTPDKNLHKPSFMPRKAAAASGRGRPVHDHSPGMQPLKIGDLFDPGDAVSQWVFALSASVTDLASIESLFHDSLHDDATPAVRTSYLFRQLVSRIYESDCVIYAIDQFDAVGEFVANLPYASEPVAYLREQFLPEGTSRVRRVFGDVRNRTAHHSRVGSRELKCALAEAADQNARILVDVEQKRLYYEWPEAVLSHALNPGFGSDQGVEEFADRARLAMEINAHFVQLLRGVIHPFVERAGQDVDRFYHPSAED